MPWIRLPVGVRAILGGINVSASETTVAPRNAPQQHRTTPRCRGIVLWIYQPLWSSKSAIEALESVTKQRQRICWMATTFATDYATIGFDATIKGISFASVMAIRCEADWWCAFISPPRTQMVLERMGEGALYRVFVDTPLAIDPRSKVI